MPRIYEGILPELQDYEVSFDGEGTISLFQKATIPSSGSMTVAKDFNFTSNRVKTKLESTGSVEQTLRTEQNFGELKNESDILLLEAVRRQYQVFTK